MKIKKIIIVFICLLIVLLFGVGVYFHGVYTQARLIGEMKIKSMIATSVLGRIEDRFLIIDAFHDTDGTKKLYLTEFSSRGTDFFIWKRTFLQERMFPDLNTDTPGFIKESISEIIKSFKRKSLGKISNIKILEKGISISEYGLPLPYVKADYKIDKDRFIFFGTNFIYIDDERFPSEITIVAMTKEGEEKRCEQELQRMIWWILKPKGREGPGVSKERDEAIRNLQNERNSLKTRKDAIESLKEIGDDEALAALITTLKDANSQIRKEAISALMYIRKKEAVEALCSALKDKDKEVRKAAALSLLEISSIYAVDPLINALEDRCKDVQLIAISALGRIRDKRAIEPLIDIIRHGEDELVRGAAVLALGRLDGKKVVDTLITALKDESIIVRRNAVNILGRIGDESIIPELSSLFEDEDKTVQEGAKKAIEEIKTRKGQAKRNRRVEG